MQKTEVVYSPIEMAAIKLREKAYRIQEAVDRIQESDAKTPDVGPLSMQLSGTKTESLLDLLMPSCRSP